MFSRSPNGSVKRQLIRVILTASLAVVGFTCIALFVFEVRSYRSETARSLATVANIIAENSAGVILFDDHKMATEILGGLRVEPEVSVAALFDKDNRLYAVFPRDLSGQTLPAAPMAVGVHLHVTDIEIVQPVMQGTARVGTIYLRGNLVGTYQRVSAYGFVVFGVGLCSLGVAFVVSRHLQRRISDPLASLAATARAVTSRKDYSVRAEKFGTDEFDELTDALNSMLDQIQRNSAALRAGEERFRNLADHMAQLAWMMDASGGVQWYNKRWLDYTGVTLDEMAGKDWGDMLDPAHRERVERKFKEALSRGEHWEDIFTLRAKDGTYRWFLSRAFPIRDEHGTIFRWFGTNTDITEQRLGEERLRAHADRAEVLSKVAAELILADSPRTVLPAILSRIAASLGAEFHFNYVFDVKSGGLVLASSGGLDPAQRARFGQLNLGEALCGSCASQLTPVIVESVQQTTTREAAGTRSLGVRAYACYPLNAGDRLLGTLSFATAARDRFEPAELHFIHTLCDLLAASMERARLAAEVRTARDAAERASAAKDEFLAALSHELRTPLNPVLLVASEAANDPTLPETVRADFSMIAKNVTVEARLIEDLLDLTRITRGKLELQNQRLEVHAVLQDAIGLVKTDIAEKRIALTVDLRAASSVIVGDHVRLQQVFWNVVKNAVKFTPAGGRISVCTRDLPAGGLAVETVDSGIGLTTDELARVFEAFTQGDHATERGSHQFGGLGLGLAISRKLVELHGGRITAESAGRDQGARFIVELPAPRVLPGPKAASNHPHATGPVELGLRILLVEDHEATRQAVSVLLKRRGHILSEAATVAAARELAETRQFDLVISDIGLPDESGYSLMHGLRGRFGLKGIAMTGYGTDNDIAEAVACGFVAHLTKPVSVQALETAMLEAATAKLHGGSRAAGDKIVEA